MQKFITLLITSIILYILVQEKLYKEPKKDNIDLDKKPIENIIPNTKNIPDKDLPKQIDVNPNSQKLINDNDNKNLGLTNQAELYKIKDETTTTDITNNEVKNLDKIDYNSSNNNLINTQNAKDLSWQNKESSPLQGNFIEKTLSKVALNMLKTESGKMFFENLITPLRRPINLDGSNSYKINNNDFLNSFFRINTFDQGKIGPAICGNIVTIHYKIFSMDNMIIEEGDKTYTLGFKVILPGIDSVVVGMMQGQTRQAILSPKYAFGLEKYHKNGINPKNYYKVSIRLDDIINNNPISKDDIKIYDDEIAYKMPLVCGSSVKFDAKITKLSNGEIIYDSQKNNKELNITVGDINYPLIFAYSLFGKIPIGIRTVISKGKTFKGITIKKTNIVETNDLPDEEYFMLELKNFELNDL